LIQFLGLSGSLRAASTNSALLAAMAANAPGQCSLALYRGLGQLPIFNPDDEGERTPLPARQLIEAASGTAGIVISCPEYAHGVPGGLKNALDWLVSTDAAVGKPAMLVHASPRSVVARAALAEVMRTMSFDMMPGPELEIPLLGRKPPDVAEILARPDNVEAMRDALSRFAAFVRDR
jgi:NAD(P)H-dependent FMN reductase